MEGVKELARNRLNEASSARLGRGEVLLADGAIGTMLMARGLARRAAPETFNLEPPELLVEIARLYLEAGADIVQTNTFGASPLKLGPLGPGRQTEAINRGAGGAVRRAAGTAPSSRLLRALRPDPAALRRRRPERFTRASDS